MFLPSLACVSAFTLMPNKISKSCYLLWFQISKIDRFRSSQELEYLDYYKKTLVIDEF